MSITRLQPEDVEVRAHRKTFASFERLVLFAAMHVTLVLSCLALAFVGHAHFLAALLGIGGTFALIIGFSIAGPRSVS